MNECLNSSHADSSVVRFVIPIINTTWCFYQTTEVNVCFVSVECVQGCDSLFF